MATLSEKRAAHRAVGDARRDGLLPAPKACACCGVVARTFKRSGRSSIVWHHWSYLPAHHLDVSAVCRSCHAHIHHGSLPEPHTTGAVQ